MTKLKNIFAPLRYRFIKSQNDDEEAKFLYSLSKITSITRNFLEIGFHPYEFNCHKLIDNKFNGLLIDANKNNIEIMNNIKKFYSLNVHLLNEMVTKTNVPEIISNFRKINGPSIGVLSIDIDGIDIYILQQILNFINVDIIITEYNSSFLLNPISVEYSDDFNRFSYSKTGWYHGASITAFYNLLKSEYDLIKNIAGLNLVFIKKQINKNQYTPLTPKTCYSEHLKRNANSKKSAEEQWNIIKDLEYKIFL